MAIPPKDKSLGILAKRIMKKSGRKHVIKTVETADEARSICVPHNNSVMNRKGGYWLEFTEDKEYTRNR